MSSTRSQPLLGDSSNSDSFVSLSDSDKSGETSTSTAVSRRRRNILVGGLILAACLALVVVLALYFLLARKEPEEIDPPYVEPDAPTTYLCPADTAPAACLRNYYLPYYKLAAYIVPSTDAHNSEYVAECDKRRQFVSNFTGSAGTAVVVNIPNVLNRLFTDNRYYIQAANQLDASQWTFNLPPASQQVQWINETVPPHSYVGIDPTLISAAQFRSQAAGLALNNITLVAVRQNLVDLIWSSRPPTPAERIFKLEWEQTGEAIDSKFQRIRAAMAQQRAGALVLSALDSIAWVTNLRGHDIAYNPYFFSYLVLTPSAATLYVNTARNGTAQAVWDYLANSSVTVRPYESFVADLPALDATLSRTSRVWMASATQAIYGGFTAANVYEAASPVDYMKARKNAVEIAAMRDAHLKDSVAFAKLWDWVESELAGGRTDMTECDVAHRIEQFRKDWGSAYVELSYETIAGSGANGAIVHYDPEGICASVNTTAMLLLDSGGQYLNGTTDTTRTAHFGKPTLFERTAVTLVAMGHIDQILNVWANGTSPTDWSARQPLLRHGLTYGHGTSHGVGDFLGVHEAIGGAVVGGVVTSVEPGYYHVINDTQYNTTYYGEDRGFGVRIETDCVVVRHHAEFAPASTAYWTFDPIVFVPIQTKLLRVELMNSRQVEWVNWYHQRCYDLVSPYLTGSALQWLHDNTQPINQTSSAY